MTLAPLLAASLAVKVHVACMAVAVALSGPQFLMRKGTARHRAVGYVWFAAMTLAALTSFFIVRKAGFRPFRPHSYPECRHYRGGALGASRCDQG